MFQLELTNSVHRQSVDRRDGEEDPMSESTATDLAQIAFYPPRDTEREPLGAPVDEVTLLEDRAQVRRIARPTLSRGQHKLFVEDVSPVIQDVSLRAKVTQGRAQIADIRIQRAIKARREYQPAEIREVDDALRKHLVRQRTIREDLARISNRAQKIKKIITLTTQEIPQDVAWGEDASESWSEDLERLFETHRKLIEQITTLHLELEEVERAHDLARQKRLLMERPDQKFSAWLELDIVVDNDEEPLAIQIDYVSPNAMWRPIHSARLDGDVLSFTSKAALWQNTGEDWEDVQLIFSTAQSSLGTDPPLLEDDLLTAQRKQEDTTVQMREVELQSASVEGGAPQGGGGSGGSSGVELQGVDDGGDVQNIRAPQRTSIASDGAPNFIELFEFKALAELERLLVAELSTRVVLRAVQRNTSKLPLLAGPVELLMQGGPIGWTQTLFVAPGERFELGFGPDEALRVVRHTRKISESKSHVDNWTHRVQRVELFLSNLGADEREIVIKERIPVSEIEKVKIAIDEAKTSSGFALDEDGILTWRATLAAHAHDRKTLEWTLSMAPDIQTS